MKPAIPRRRLIGRTAAMAAAFLAGGAFGAARPSAQGRLPLTIGYQESPDWLLFVARDLKLFERAGLAPSYVKFDAGLQMIDAMESRTLDIASVGSVSFLVGLSRGLDWRMIGVNPEGAYSEGLVARKDGAIANPSDVKGKRIGLFKGATAQFGLTMILREHGIRPDQVTLIHMTPAEQVIALRDRKIDAAMVGEPWIHRMMYEAAARLVTTEGAVGVYTNVDGYAVRREWLLQNRETALRFLRGLLMANDVVQKDPSVAVRLWAGEMNIKEAWAEAIYDVVPPPLIHQWANPQYTYSLVQDSPLHRALGVLATYLFDAKLISQVVDVHGVTDPSVIKEALRAWKGGR
jgi:ABC-type nitrate/sulfonate/bicarbonate transport system substrate-binding protein